MSSGTKTDGASTAGQIAEQPAEEGGFLGRWSRLKREGQVAALPVEQAAPDIDDHATAKGDITHAQPDDQKLDAAKRELDELLAKLPKLDEICATTDVTGFMHRLVPDALRNAALRAAWSADPAIRDFLNDAREYALDYNTPGAAYGYGPLTESDIAGLDEMVRGIFGDKPKPEVEAEGEKTLVEDHTLPAGEIGDISAQGQPVAARNLRQDQDIPHSVRLSTIPMDQLETVKSIEEMPDGAARMAEGSNDSQLAAAQQNDIDARASSSDHSTYRRRGGSAMPA